MKKGILTIAVLMVLLVVLFLPGCSGARVSELEAKVATLESEVATGNAAIAGLQGQITSLGQKIGELNEKLAVEKAKATGLQGMVTEKDGRIKSLSDNLTAKDGQIAALQTEVSSLKSLQAADPTYDGLMEFIKKDTTDKELSNFPVDFFAGAAQKFLENAVKAGIKGHYVRAQVKSGGPYSFTGFPAYS